MQRHWFRVLICGLGFLALSANESLGNRGGAIAGLSGGPLGWGASCTECHGYETGPGYNQANGLPAAYEPGVTYDLSVRVADSTQAGAGFQFSAEANGATVGDLVITDPVHTKLIDAGDGNFYVGHTMQGVMDSVTNWSSQGGMVDYVFQWQAPATDIGPITFYAAGNAINDNHNNTGDIVYLASVTVETVVPGDGDDDGDADFADFTGFQVCFDEEPLTEYCTLFDLDPSGTIDLFDYSAFLDVVTGPTALGPSVYRHADAARGGRLYDKWWAVNGAPEPTGDHPLYPPEGQQTGPTTFRCKECHGWDYKGVDGAYAQGSHYTGIKGVFGNTLNARQIFDLIKDDTPPYGHNLAAYGLADADIWDLVKFLREHLPDSDDFINEFGVFLGDAGAGELTFLLTCSACHGMDGRAINFRTEQDPEYIGTVASGNPWEFLHKVRAGQPGPPMPSFINLRWTAQRAADVGAHAQTLPTK